MDYIGCPVVVGMPLPADYKADARIITVLERWDRTELADTYYVPSPFPSLGRDKIVSYAQYRIPTPRYVLFVDADVLPRNNTLDKLLDHDKDIVTGVYPVLNQSEITWSVSRDGQSLCKLDELPTNLFKVKHCGFGITLVRTIVFERLGWPYWKNEYMPGQIVKGEDVYFCEKAIAAGFDIWCDPKIKCNHIRMANYLNVVQNILKGQTK